MTIAPILMRAEELRAGDVIDFLGNRKVVTRVRPYDGPILECFALIEWEPSSGPSDGMSLCRGDYVEVFARGVSV